jgi:type I site-specific restriction endonuclease
LGVNITNLRTLVFASPSKSKYRVLQSIGRALRMSEGKSHATLVDIVDDLRIGKHVNFVFQHAQQRIEYYSTEKFPYTLHQYPLSQAVALKTGLEALGLTNPTPSDTQATI